MFSLPPFPSLLSLLPLTSSHPRITAANPIYRLLSVPCDPTEFQIESGQVLVNKKGQDGRNLVALLVAEGMMRESEWWFKMSGGDKDTFVSFCIHFIPITPQRRGKGGSRRGIILTDPLPSSCARRDSASTSFQFPTPVPLISSRR